MAPNHLAIYLCILSHFIYCNACYDCPASPPVPADGNDACDHCPSPPPPPAGGDDACDDCTSPPPQPEDGGEPAVKYCPRDALKFGICAGMLGQDVSIGDEPSTPCCSIMQHMADFELGVCLCTAIKANILGIDVNVPLSFSMLLNACGQKTPSDFQCE